jgi:hypothetical protein
MNKKMSLTHVLQNMILDLVWLLHKVYNSPVSSIRGSLFIVLVKQSLERHWDWGMAGDYGWG